jgi:hypothetical protein
LDAVEVLEFMGLAHFSFTIKELKAHLGSNVFYLVWIFEENLNPLKWWNMCTPLVKPVRGDW